MKNGKVKLLILDWSGTISDDRKPVYQANKLLLGNYGLKIPPFNQWLKETVATLPDYVKSKGVTKSPAEIYDDYTLAYRRIVESGMASPIVYPDAGRFLFHIKGLGKRMTVLSSHPQKSLEEEARRYCVYDYFERIVGSIGDKTQAIAFLLNDLDIDPNEAVFLGDTIHDIIAARNNRTESLAVCCGYHQREKLEKENPSLGVFSTLTEIMDRRVFL